MAASDSTIDVSVIPADSRDAQEMIQLLDADLHERYPEGPFHPFFASEVADGKGAFVIARMDGRSVGCGAVRPLSPGVGEIKRIFVMREMRGRGVAREILGKIESLAADLGFHTLRLETGNLQPEAIALYERAGFRRIAKFGDYVDDPFSICFEKRLFDAARTVGAKDA